MIIAVIFYHHVRKHKNRIIFDLTEGIPDDPLYFRQLIVHSIPVHKQVLCRFGQAGLVDHEGIARIQSICVMILVIEEDAHNVRVGHVVESVVVMGPVIFLGGKVDQIQLMVLGE